MSYILCEKRGKNLVEINIFDTYKQAEEYAYKTGLWEYRIFDEKQTEASPEYYPEITAYDDEEAPPRKHGFSRVIEASKRSYRKTGNFNFLDPLNKKRRLNQEERF